MNAFPCLNFSRVLESRRPRGGWCSAAICSLLTAGFFFSSCSSPLPLVRGDQTYSSQSSYFESLEANSCEATIYHELETTLLAKATLWTEDFRRAYRNEYARTYRLSEQEEAELEAELGREATNGVDILIWVSAKKSKLASLKPEDEVWRLKLFSAKGTGVRPLNVTHIKRPSPKLQHFFPYLTGLGEVYKVTFPLSAPGAGSFLEEEQIILQLAGAPGSLELSWFPKRMH